MSEWSLEVNGEPFIPGTWVLQGRGVWRYSGRSPEGLACIQRPAHPGILEVEFQSLRPLVLTDFNPEAIRPFQLYPPEHQKEALRRREVINGLLAGEWTATSLREAAKKLGTSTVTTVRHVDRYLISGCKVESLIPRVLRFGIANNKLKDDVEEVIREAITVYYLDPSRIPFSGIVSAVRRTCKERRLRPPCANAIRKRIQQVPVDEATLHRHGVKAAREIFAPQPGKAPEGDGPLCMVEIDHTPMNVFCRLPDGRTLRPWITMAIDAYTRMVLGFYLSFDPPSRLSVGMCLFRALTPKEEWLRRHGITTPWPCSGKPILVQTDNAREFRSYDMDRICLELDIVLQWRMVDVPEFGGRIERLMGAAAMAVEFLPGKSFRSVTERGEYPAEDMATLDLQTLERALLHYFVEIYHHKGHRGLRKRTPIHEWRAAENRIPASLRTGVPANIHMLLTLMPTFTRKILQNGVSWEGITYHDSVLNNHIGRPNPESADGKYRFAYDPRDIRFIYWRPPATQAWHRLQARDLGMQAMTLWERDHLLEVDRKEARDSGDNEIVERGEAALMKIADEQKRLSLRALRETKRAKAKDRTTKKVVPPVEFSLVSPGVQTMRLAPREPDSTLWMDIPIFGAESL